jgi:L-ascorbate metabolism protein UlaG (beta-lactamase superfamily)
VGSARFLSKAAASQLRRYPLELARSLRAGNAPSGRALDADESGFGARWSAALGVEGPGLLAAWLGHAGVLLRWPGRDGSLSVVCDPVLSDRIGPRLFGGGLIARGLLGAGLGAREDPALGGRVLGPRRLVPAFAGPAALGPIDLVLITHAHFDHLDRPTLATLARLSPHAHVVVPRGTRALIPRGFAGVHEARWEKPVVVAGARVLALRPKHWGARMIWDRHRGFNSYVVEPAEPEGGTLWGHARRVLLAGDTAETDVFDALAGRVGPVGLACLGIGAYDPWVHHHATPEQAWGMFQRSGAGRMMPIHHATFQLGDEPPGEPIERLLRVAGRAGEPLIVGRELGGVVRVGAGEGGTA